MQMHRSEQFEYKCVLKFEIEAARGKNFVVLISRYLFKFVHLPVHDTFLSGFSGGRLKVIENQTEMEKVLH
jgi:hypothetical protein